MVAATWRCCTSDWGVWYQSKEVWIQPDPIYICFGWHLLKRNRSHKTKIDSGTSQLFLVDCYRNQPKPILTRQARFAVKKLK